MNDSKPDVLLASNELIARARTLGLAGECSTCNGNAYPYLRYDGYGHISHGDIVCLGCAGSGLATTPGDLLMAVLTSPGFEVKASTGQWPSVVVRVVESLGNGYVASHDRTTTSIAAAALTAWCSAKEAERCSTRP